MAGPILTIDGTAYDTVQATGQEAVDAQFTIRVKANGDGTAKTADLVGKKASLAITTKAGDSLTMTGIVRAVDIVFASGGQTFDFEIGPAAELFAQGQDSFVYLAQTASDIVSAAFTRAGLASGTDFKMSISATLSSRPYTVQYRESHFAFAERLFREEGVYWFYDHTDSGTVLTFADDSTSATALSATFIHRIHWGAITTKPWIGRVASKSVVVTNKLTTNDRDPLKPTLALSDSESTDNGDLEVYAWPARAIVSADVKTRATNSLTALQARRQLVTAKSGTLGITPGKILTVDDDDSPLTDALKSLFILETNWSCQADGTFELDFVAVPSANAYRPAWKQPGRAPLGAETAFVRGSSGAEITVDANGNVSTQPPWDRNTATDDKTTVPIRVGQALLGHSMAIPRVGWTTLQAHHDDDIDRPWVERRLVDGAHPVPFKFPDNMTRTSWQTLTSKSDNTFSEIVFEDKTGSEQVIVQAAKDMQVTINDNEARTIGNRHVIEVDGDRSVTISADEKLTVTKDQSTTVKGNETTSIDGNRSLTIKGGETTTISGGRTEKATKDRTIDVGGKRSLTVSSNMSVSSSKELTREILGKHTITASAAWTTQCDGGLTMTTKGDGEETVAAARTSNGKNGMNTLVQGDLTDTIGAAHTITAKGSVGETAKGKMDLTVSAALTATAASTIEFSADSEITITCGGASLSIKSSGVEIKAPLLSITGPLVVLDGSTVKHNP